MTYRSVGYKQSAIDRMNYETSPALCLLTDWIVSTGNTSLSVDLLMSYLEQIDRIDIVDEIHRVQGPLTPISRIMIIIIIMIRTIVKLDIACSVLQYFRSASLGAMHAANRPPT